MAPADGLQPLAIARAIRLPPFGGNFPHRLSTSLRGFFAAPGLVEELVIVRRADRRIAFIIPYPGIIDRAGQNVDIICQAWYRRSKATRQGEEV